VYFGLEPGADVRGSDIKTDGAMGISFTVNGQCGTGRVQLPLAGSFNVFNALAAISVGHYFGLSLDEMAAALRGVKPGAMRLDVSVRADGTLIIDDAYNANPVSMRGALETMADLALGRRTVAVVGDMLELGEFAPPAHKEVGRLAAELGVGCLIAAGSWAPDVVQGAVAAGLDQNRAFVCPDAAAAAEVAGREVQPEDVVLVKASRGMQFEQVVAMLKQEGCR
jgi:UDP-N-acetylmuramoyl-tripeptide--D-alanyl-D-alanine ligase